MKKIFSLFVLICLMLACLPAAMASEVLDTVGYTAADAYASATIAPVVFVASQAEACVLEDLGFLISTNILFEKGDSNFMMASGVNILLEFHNQAKAFTISALTNLHIDPGRRFAQPG